MKTSTYIVEQSDFLTDFALSLNEMPAMAAGVIKHFGRVARRQISRVWHLVRSEQAQFVMIVAAGALIIGLQLRSLLF